MRRKSKGRPVDVCIMDVSLRDWAVIPALIVEMLVVKLDMFSDYVHFCGVCLKWRCVALEANVDHKTNLDIIKASRRKLPMLMFKTDENNYKRSLYNVSRKETYTVKLPIPYKYRFVGSSLGWLFCVQENMVVTLVNPFNNRIISLPVFKDPRKLFRHWRRIYLEYYITKGILLSDPSASPDSFGVVVLFQSKLSFFKSGESSWNLINSKLLISDIIYYKDKLYGISFWGQFVQIDLDSRTIKTIIRGTEQCPVSCIYLVESQAGELLMVKRVWMRSEQHYVGGGPNVEDHSDNEENVDNIEVTDDDEYYDTDDNDIPYSDYDEFLANEVVNDDDDDNDDDEHSPILSFEFNVFKMTRLTEESPTWVELNNIGEQALFVGDNQSLCISTTDFHGCMSNSIYFTSGLHSGCFPYTYYGLEEDCGIFNLEDGMFYTHHVLGSSYKYMQPPIWFVPNPRSTNLNLV